MIGSLLMDHVDIVASSLTLTPSRHSVIDFLYPMGSETYAIYIGNPGLEDLDWDIYTQPFSQSLWIFLAFSVAALALLIFLIDLAYAKKEGLHLHDQSFFTVSTRATKMLVGDMWTVFSAYFGGRPAFPPPEHRWGSRLLVLSILLTGNMVFMSYRAAVTSNLATWTIKLPFNDLSGLLRMSGMM